MQQKVDDGYVFLAVLKGFGKHQTGIVLVFMNFVEQDKVQTT